MEYGSDEHLDGLSRNALKTEVRWWHDRATEMEGECERLQAENVRLQDENARLRSCLSDDAENARMIMAENAKLRELVRVFYHCTTSGECDECPINGGSTVHLMPDTICGTIHDRMRGLGVEVE